LKKALSLAKKRELVDVIVIHGVSVRKACCALHLPRSSYVYKPLARNDGPIIDALKELVAKHPAIGFWKCYHRLRLMGYPWNNKRVYRVYCQLGLNIRRRTKKRLPTRVKQPLDEPTSQNQMWSIDYMSDSLWDGRKFRLLNIIDDYKREALHMEIDTSIPSLRLVRILNQIKQYRGVPQTIRTDNGPEFISSNLYQWATENQVELRFIQPGKPTQNAFIERFNGSVRKELLDANIFNSLDQARQKLEEWFIDYNYYRPHESLKNKPPNWAVKATKI
jgi:putative transposase